MSYQPPPPPSYVPAAPRPQPLGGVATGVTVVLGLGALFALGAAALFLSRARLAQDFLDGNTTLRQLDDADHRFQAFVALFFVAFAVVFIVWQYRHAKNAELLRGRLPLGPGWAIGGWFIPLANYVLPAVQLSQAAKASDPVSPASPPEPWVTSAPIGAEVTQHSSGGPQGRAPGIIVAWAVVLGLSALLFAVGSNTRPDDNDIRRGATIRSSIDDFARADRLAAAGMFGYAVAAALAIGMVRTLTARQEASLAARATAPQYPQYPQYPPP